MDWPWIVAVAYSLVGLWFGLHLYRAFNKTADPRDRDDIAQKAAWTGLLWPFVIIVWLRRSRRR